MADSLIRDIVAVKPRIADRLTGPVMDYINTGKGVLRVKVLANESGKIVNNRVYPYTDLSEGYKQWVGGPWRKKVLKYHRWGGGIFEQDTDPIGFVVEAEIVPRLEGKDLLEDYLNPEFDYTKPGSAQGFLTLEIVDKDAAEKFMDGRFDAVSTGALVKKAYCSVCGNIIGTEGCTHIPGETYDVEDEDGNTHEKFCYVYSEGWTPVEVSVVNIPALGTTKVVKIGEAEDAVEVAVMDSLDTQCFLVLDSKVTDGGRVFDLSEEGIMSDIKDTDKTVVSVSKTDVKDTEDETKKVVDDKPKDVEPKVDDTDKVDTDNDTTPIVNDDTDDKPEASDKVDIDNAKDDKPDNSEDAIKDSGEEEVDKDESPDTDIKDEKDDEPVSNDSDVDKDEVFGFDTYEDFAFAHVVYSVCKEELNHLGEPDEDADEGTVDSSTEDLWNIHDTFEDFLLELEDGYNDARLTAKQRRALKKSQFCGPNRSFPVPDCAHVTAARRLLGRYKGPGDKKKIRACIERKAKALGCDKKKSKDSYEDLLIKYEELAEKYCDLETKFDALNAKYEKDKGAFDLRLGELKSENDSMKNLLETKNGQLLSLAKYVYVLVNKDAAVNEVKEFIEKASLEDLLSEVLTDEVKDVVFATLDFINRNDVRSDDNGEPPSKKDDGGVRVEYFDTYRRFIKS